MKCVALALLLVLAETAPAQDLSFEVASVKPNTSRTGGPADSALGCHGTDSHNPNSTIPMGRCVVRREALRYVLALRVQHSTGDVECIRREGAGRSGLGPVGGLQHRCESRNASD